MLPAGSPLSAWLSWLETLSPREIDLGLERVLDVLGRLEIVYPDHVLTIAGTNGKGSSVAMAEALLRAAGMRVGTYTSPHVVSYNERIVVDGLAAEDATIVAAFEEIEAVRNDVPLTYFEYGTLAAFVVFARAGVDVWLLEVGMGGRLDAVNSVDATGVLITNVSLDHCDWLGDNVEAIAVEKAGVMRPGVPAVYGGRDVPRSIVQHAQDIGAHLLLPERDYPVDEAIKPGLAGDFQVGNAAAVLALLAAAGLAAATEPGLVARVLPTVQLPGRGQRAEREGVAWLFDVAHNPAAAEALADTLAANRAGGRTIAVVAMLADKDVEGFARTLDTHVGRWIAAPADGSRALPAGELARRIAAATDRPCLIADSCEDALQLAQGEAVAGDRIVVTGSFYIVGPALQHLGLYSPRKS